MHADEHVLMYLHVCMKILTFNAAQSDRKIHYARITYLYTQFLMQREYNDKLLAYY